MWKDYDLPSFCFIRGQKFLIKTDWKNIIDIIEILNDRELLILEKLDCALDKFYQNYQELPDVLEAVEQLFLFVSGNQRTMEGENRKDKLRLIDWKKDLHLIIPPVNKALGYDVRENNVHWWTFLGAFNEIGNCSFKTYVAIRYKILKKQKLEKWEREFYLENKSEIDLEKRAEHDNFDDEDILIQLMKKEAITNGE